ncbi:ECF RNA polymerase sigma factor SigE [Aquisphaera giovannonii]|uniref:ECF RNA polymerase sigma factor SigE n=1 Tax=Aquisphaera giovannonii TaxID=406548 RepID=A0A5B9W6T7_9BACT|nr:sigma-70 family RNA polymerase sigma factor [Aquisphaera giovannonii]QEH35944.1 ECF RNA polymerase sigma factor SigE [Aquisphaera giovannonii]
MAPTDKVADSIGRLFREGTADGVSDGELLDRFLSRRDEDAFAAIVARHGPMVLRVCREVLRDEHRAQDAFQATFLVLVRRAREVRRDRSAGPWLFGVCRRIAVRARADEARRRAREREATEVRSIERDEPEGAGPATGPDAWPELYEELDRLPESQRAALVICYLEGLTTDEAARRLGCARGTILSRLARGRERLRARLTRRGLEIPAVLLAASSSPEARASAVPPALVESTTRAAIQFAAGGSAVAAAPAAVAAMMEGARRPMMTISLKVGATLLGAGLAAGALALVQGKSEPPKPITFATSSASRSEAPPPDAVPGTAALTRAATGRILAGNKAPFFCVAFVDGGEAIASGDSDGLIRIWDTATGRCRNELLLKPLKGDHVAALSLASSANGMALAAACDDMSIRLFDAPSLGRPRSIPRRYFVDALAFSPDGRTLAWAGSYPPHSPAPDAGDWNAISLWDTAIGEVRGTIRYRNRGVHAIAYSADGSTIAAGSDDRIVSLWQADSGRRIATIPLQGTPHNLAISPDGKTLVAAHGKSQRDGDRHSIGMSNFIGPIEVWDVDARRRRTVNAPEKYMTRGVAFSPDGKALAYALSTNEIVLCDTGSLVPRVSLRGHQGYIHDLTFSHDGKTLASASADRTVRLWDLADLLPAVAGNPR